MRVVEDVGAERAERTERSERTESVLIERIIGEKSSLDVIAAEEDRRVRLEANSSPDGAGLVAGILLGGISWAVILASVWLIVR